MQVFPENEPSDSQMRRSHSNAIEPHSDHGWTTQVGQGIMTDHDSFRFDYHVKLEIALELLISDRR